ncbi:MAG TPA: HmuY family protein [Niabella sp.]|nr:HmuY family protein [Niabella sp.]
MRTTLKFLLILTVLGIVFAGCSKDDPPLPPVQVGFSATELGFDAATSNLTVTLEATRAQTVAVPVTINVTTTGLTTGTDFSTDPAIASGTLSVTIPANSTSVTFKITKAEGLLLSGSEKINFEIASATDAVIGTKKDLSVSLSAITSEGSTDFAIPGKTDASNYASSVYIDFSNNVAIAADRQSWNIGFTTGSDFKVVLNPYHLSKAWKLNKTDITTVISTADTTGSGLNFGQYSTPITAIDDISGDLTKTVFGDIATSEADAKVIIYAKEFDTDPANWYRIKVSRNGSGYKLQYAKYNETTVKTVNIDKNSDYNLIFFSLETDKVVSVEPKANNWDIQWSYSFYQTATLAYAFQDLISLNYMAGAEAAEVISTTATWDTDFNAFARSNVSSLTFLKTKDAIGDKWRVTTGSGIKKDRFYVVKDPSGNYYKLRFKKMGVGDTGQRGRPEIDYVLLK